LYLKHLLTERGLLVHDRRTGAIGFLDEQNVRERIRLGVIRPIGGRNAIRELNWLGAKWKPVVLAAEAAGYKESRGHKTEYSHDRETEENPVNVWMLIWLPFTARIYGAVYNSCIAPFFDPDPPEGSSAPRYVHRHDSSKL